MARPIKGNRLKLSGDQITAQIAANTIEARKAISELHQYLGREDIKRTPHEGQKELLRALFNDHVKVVQGQLGRSAGKTEMILYIAWRYAIENPGSLIYIICPELKQAKKIYWISKRLQNYGPRHLLMDGDHAFRETELRIIFKNGSTIMLDGCENYEALRGIKPHLVIYDEFQHHSRDFDVEVMQPNLSSGKVSLVVMGTPPKRSCYYTEFKENLQHHVRAGDPKWRYFELPSWVNPTLDMDWLMQKKAELIRTKRLNVWLREYEGKDAFDQEGAIFPMFSKAEHVYPHDVLKETIEKDAGKLRWYAIFDPGTSTCFAVLFVAWNPYSGEVTLIDEIYEKDRTRITATAIWERANGIKAKYGVPLYRWQNVYDEAAAWFANEIIAAYSDKDRFSLSSTRKYHGNKSYADNSRPGESLLMDIMLIPGRFRVASTCENFLYEMEQYIRDDRGRYPKDNDHLMDCLYYWALESGYRLITDETPEDKEKRMMDMYRVLTPEQYIEKKRKEEDLLYAIESTDEFFEEAAWN